MIAAIIAALLKFAGELLGPLLAAPATTGRLAPGTLPLQPSPLADIHARARRAGLLLLVASVLGGCGVFERRKEIVVATLFPAEDMPGGFPILAQGTVTVILPDGTLGTIENAGGMRLIHNADLKALLKAR